MLKKDAKVIVGGLSKPSKMPGFSIGLPALECNVGSKLRQCEGSVCSDCYALKGSYTQYPAVFKAQYRRLDAIYKPEWIEAMVTLITGQKFFRWHDAGDLQSMQHLKNIIQVVVDTPNTKHWLPTKEKRLVKEYIKTYGNFPENIVVRISAAMVDGSPVKGFLNTSTVHKALKPSGHACPAPENDGACGDCRACWDVKVLNVSYHKH